MVTTCKKNVVIFTAYGLWPMLEFELDIIQRELDIGNRVIFLHCFGRQNYCPANNPKPGQKFKKRKCQECVSRVKSGINWLNYDSSKLIVAEFESITRDEIKSIKETLFKLAGEKRDKEIIQSIVNVEGMDIFESAYSQLITELSDSRPNLESNWALFESLLEIGLISYYSAVKVFQAYSPDKVYVFNGRLSRYRSIMRLAQRNDCELLVYEFPLFGFEKYSVITNTYSHHVNEVSRQWRIAFETSEASSNTVQTIAEDWYEDRSNFRFDPRNGILLKDTFTHIHKATGLPKYWDITRFNIVFFISSEFERADIDENKQVTPLSQAEAVRLISSTFPEAVCTVRVHPNLKNRDHKFVEELQGLQYLNNVKYISACANWDSYDLLMAANLILTFGSTIGVEAAFRKKPVLNIGPAYYSAFNCVACCQEAKELIYLVDAAAKNDLSSFPTSEQRYTGACQYAYAYLNSGVSPKYLEKDSYFGGYMLRDGEKTRISADKWIKFINRTFGLGPRFYLLVRLLVENPSEAKKIRPGNVLRKFREIFYGEIP